MATTEFPDDCVQSVLGGKWWVPTASKQIVRGSLLRAFIPIPGMTPMTLTAKRAAANEHETAEIVVAPLRAGAKPMKPLPVAAMPVFDGEVHVVMRAKFRPVLVLGVGEQVDPRSFGGSKGWQTHQMLRVAPYFGVESGSSRGGWHPEFVKRIRHARLASYFYDQLPHDKEPSSILRLDQAQPIAAHHDSYELLGWTLSETAMAVIEEQDRWFSTGTLNANTDLGVAHEYLGQLG